MKHLSYLLILSMPFFAIGCGDDNDNDNFTVSPIETPSRPPQEPPQGNPQLNAGLRALRFETFGNEGFWTDAAKLPQGIVAAKLTPVQALKLGLSVNTQALDAATLTAVAAELKAQGTSGPILNDPATTIKLINANAVIGVVVRDTNSDGKLDVATGDKVGVSCVLCHAITDGSALNVPNGGSIGTQIDGPGVHNIQVGKIFAVAANTRALYPMAQLKGADGKSIGRAPSDMGLTKDSTEAQFDAYFGNSAFYPVGMFDDTVDGNGNPMHNSPLFQQDLAAPFGSAGELVTFNQFGNTVFTVLLDPTNLTTPGGRAFLNTVAGAAGDKIANDYVEVLTETGVTNYPFVKGSRTGPPGSPDTILGIGVDLATLQAMTAYTASLRSPKGVVSQPSAVSRGRAVYLDAANRCTTCHNADQSLPVRSDIIPMKTIFPGDNPTILAERAAPLNPVMNTPGNTFDDKMIVINASLRGLERGTALPLLMDLARKPKFLHDDSVSSLDNLLNDSRGVNAPHPFYVGDSSRTDLVQYLRSLDDTSK